MIHVREYLFWKMASMIMRGEKFQDMPPISWRTRKVDSKSQTTSDGLRIRSSRMEADPCSSSIRERENSVFPCVFVLFHPTKDFKMASHSVE